MGDRHSDLAHLPARQLMIGVVARLGRKIEGDRKPGLASGEIGAIEAFALGRRRMPAIGAEDPWLIAPGPGHGRREARAMLRRNRAFRPRRTTKLAKITKRIKRPPVPAFALCPSRRLWLKFRSGAK